MVLTRRIKKSTRFAVILEERQFGMHTLFLCICLAWFKYIYRCNVVWSEDLSRWKKINKSRNQGGRIAIHNNNNHYLNHNYKNNIDRHLHRHLHKKIIMWSTNTTNTTNITTTIIITIAIFINKKTETVVSLEIKCKLIILETFIRSFNSLSGSSMFHQKCTNLNSLIISLCPNLL